MAAETETPNVETVAKLLLAEGPPDAENTRYILDAVNAATDDALRVLGDRIECHTAAGGTVSPQLTALRGETRSREAKAAAAFFAARAAEGAGDSATARILIDEALTLRPGMEPALHDAAQYAAIRGDYPIADRYLRRAELPSPLRPGLSDALAVTAGNIARNDPCPCGSGRKFKVCCRRDGAPPLAARAALLYALLGTYAERAPSLEITTPLIERTEDAQRCAMFCVDVALFRGGLVEKFLATRGDWLRPDERDLITAWQQVPFTLYETVEVQRDTGVTLRALPDGEPIHLSDVQFSRSAQRLELICGRILHHDTGPVMLAMPVHIARHHRRAMLDLLAADPTAEQIADFLGPEPPVRLRNSDGDDLYDCSVTYRVSDPEHTFEALTQRLTRTGDNVVARRRPVPDGRVLSLGQIHRDGDDFTLTANSPARLADLESVLRDVAADATEQNRRAEPLSSPGPDDPSGREARVLVKESYYLDAGVENDTADADSTAAERMSRDAETAWLDTPGVIGDLSPRETAATDDPALRAELRSLIDDVEATLLQAQRAGYPSAGLMDPQRLRDALELDAVRSCARCRVSRTGPP